MNNFFSDAALNLDVDRNLNTQKSNAVDSVLKAIEVYKDHPSIIKINQQNIIKSSFNFQYDYWMIFVKVKLLLLSRN